MATTVRGLINKTHWTGRDLGIAILLRMKQANERKKKKNREPFPFSDQFFSARLGMLSSKQRAVYAEYLSIYNALLDGNSLINGMIQQFYSGFYRYLFSLSFVHQDEIISGVLDMEPVILTQKKHDEILARCRKRQAGIKEDYNDVIIHACFYYAKKHEAGEKIPAQIEGALDLLQEKPVTDEAARRIYASMVPAYRFTLPDGRDSDEMTHKEWTKALSDACGGKRLSLYHKIFFDGDEGLKRIYKRNTGRALKKAELGAARSAFSLLIDAANNSRIPSFPSPLSAGLFPEPIKIKAEGNGHGTSKGISHYDMLFAPEEDVAGYYGKAFKDSFPILYRAVQAELKKALPTAKAGGSLTWGELAAAGFCDYDSLARIDSFNEPIGADEDEDERTIFRVCRNGFAIYQGRESEYENPLSKGNIHLGIDYLMHDDVITQTMQAALEDLALPAMRFIYGFNSLVLAIADVYKLPFMRGLVHDLTVQEEKMEDANRLLWRLYYSATGTPEEQEKKRAFIKDWFYTVEIEELKPTQEAEERLRARLQSVKGTEPAQAFFKDYARIVIETMKDGGETKWGRDLGVVSN